MLFALIDGKKVAAFPKALGICQLCNEKVFARCGELNVWHWSHYKVKSCDNWFEPETDWHKNWKLIFGEQNSEIVISENGVRHVADVLTKDNTVIELQNSPIQTNVIGKREAFYGERMIWVVNGIQIKEQFRIYKSPLEEDEEYYRLHNPLYKYYRQPLSEGSRNEFHFSWTWPKRSWMVALRKVYIDFGDENLFLVEEGMGTNWGKGKQIRKEAFIRLHGGNLSLLETIIVKSK